MSLLSPVPCVALIHARINHIILGAPEPRAGALTSQLALLDKDHFNHSMGWTGGTSRRPMSRFNERFLVSDDSISYKASGEGLPIFLFFVLSIFWLDCCETEFIVGKIGSTEYCRHK